MTTDTRASVLFLESSPNNNTSKEGSSQDYKSSSTAKWTPLLLLAGATCCIGSAVPAGFNIGVMNNPKEILEKYCSKSIKIQYDKEISPENLKILWSIVTSIFLIGGMTGSLIAGWIANKFGRRGGLAIGNISGIIGGIIFFITPYTESVIPLFVGRIVVGFSSGVATTLQPMYLMEIAPLKLRGAVGVLCQLGITIGVFIGQVVGLEAVLGTDHLWPYMLASFAPLCLIALGLLYRLPESPKYLYIIKQEKEKAIYELHRLYKSQELMLQREIFTLENELAQSDSSSSSSSSSSSWTVGRVLKNQSLRLPLLLVASLQLGQQLSGVNAVFNYSTEIFKQAGLVETNRRQYATLGTGAINILMAVVSVRIMMYFGRRTLLFCSCICSALCLTVLTIGIINKDASTAMPWICLAAVLLYVLVYGIGLGPIPYFIGSELFEVGPRPVAMSLGSLCNWTGNFLVVSLFEYLSSDAVLNGYAYLIFVFFIILLTLFNRRYLPETRGVDTAEITALLSQGFRSEI